MGASRPAPGTLPPASPLCACATGHGGGRSPPPPPRASLTFPTLATHMTSSGLFKVFHGTVYRGICTAPANHSPASNQSPYTMALPVVLWRSLPALHPNPRLSKPMYNASNSFLSASAVRSSATAEWYNSYHGASAPRHARRPLAAAGLAVEPEWSPRTLAMSGR